MSEPIRHEASPRNRRKLMHNAKCLKEEIEFLLTDSVQREVNLKYALHRVCTLLNRLEAEAIRWREHGEIEIVEKEKHK